MREKQNELEAIIFDVDGTLVDSNDLHARAWQKAFAHFGKELTLDQVRAFPGVREAFESLRKRGLTLFLASSADPDEVKHHTELLGIEDIIKGSTSAEDAEFSKPSPEIFEAARERLGTEAGRTLTVGDTPYDILASDRASIPIAAVLSGGFDRSTLDKAEFVFDDLTDLLRRFRDIEAYFAAG